MWKLTNGCVKDLCAQQSSGGWRSTGTERRRHAQRLTHKVNTRRLDKQGQAVKVAARAAESRDEVVHRCRVSFGSITTSRFMLKREHYRPIYIFQNNFNQYLSSSPQDGFLIATNLLGLRSVYSSRHIVVWLNLLQAMVTSNKPGAAVDHSYHPVVCFSNAPCRYSGRLREIAQQRLRPGASANHKRGFGM